MKKILFILGLLLSGFVCLQAVEKSFVKERFEVVAGELKLSLMVGDDNRLYQLGFGNVADSVRAPKKMPSRESEFFPPYGNGVLTDPALQVTHADGNTSTELCYKGHRVEDLGEGVSQTVISLADPVYPFAVDVYIKCYKDESLMEMWNVVKHSEQAPVVLYRFASIAPTLTGKEYWLTQFSGNYKREATLTEERLARGIKILDSKLGVRAHQMCIPSFLLSLNGPASEKEGEVLAGSLRWSGSFQFAFEVDWNNRLRLLTGMNPIGSQYYLEKGEEFATPSMLYAYSARGKGEVSRRFHRWALKYGVRDAHKDRPVLLNNWEATHCDFDEARLTELFEGAREVGAELFLLDDGWFGNGPYSRDDDKHGLGDWQPSVKKLPHGLSYIAGEARKRGVGFGIWLEPEMVNPQSELYQKHPDWIITQPGRKPILGRHQEILDLTRPEVQAFEWGVIDGTLRPNHDITYVKWDCNRYITQPGSSYLPADRQSHLWIDYNRELYRLMDKMATQHPNVMVMLCSGGSGRVDYGALPYFHGFWPSDNTDPLARIKIQWGFSHFFPACAISAHVTRMGKRHLKLATDVALSGAFGIDLALDRATDEERGQIAEAVRLYKSRIRPLVMQGELYRLSSPYEHPLASLSYVSTDKSEAVVYLYQVADGNVPRVCLEGLDASREYVVEEVNLVKGTTSRFALHSKRVSGAELMEKGIENPLSAQFESAVLIVKVEK